MKYSSSLISVKVGVLKALYSTDIYRYKVGAICWKKYLSSLVLKGGKGSGGVRLSFQRWPR
jgi:hypothetical protein